MVRTDFPDWPCHGQDAPSQRPPAIQQRWWWQMTSDGETGVIGEFGSNVANGMDAETARHIIKIHNRFLKVGGG